MSQKIDLTRRIILGGTGLAAGSLLVNGGLPSWLVGSRYQALNFDDALALLDLSLSPEQRAHTVLPLNDASRQVSNTEAIHKDQHIGTLFDANQQALIRRLYQTMLSDQGQRWLQNTTSLEGKFSGSSFKIYSDQAAGDLSGGSTQVMLNGGHYLLRSDFVDSPHALGGPNAYGQQLGNGRFKVQGNAFKAHGDALNIFVKKLSNAERQQAYLSTPPMELLLQTQGAQGSFSGLRLGDTSEETQEQALQMLATLFAAYPQTQQADAFSAIEENGGVKELHLSLYRDSSFYADGSRLSDENNFKQELAYTQVWRIEGPACVIHFKGYPHVHAYMNIVREPQRAAIGEQLAELSAPVYESHVQTLLQASLKYASGENLAYYPLSIAGRLSPGSVTTGSIYALEPFDNKIVVVDIDAAQMSAPLKMSLSAQGLNLDSKQQLRVATIDYMLRDTSLFGVPNRVVSQGGSLRDSVISQLRKNGLKV